MTTARQLRHELAAELRDALGAPWTVYAVPPETITAPAVVISPGAPYRQRSTSCDYELRLQLSVLAGRQASTDGVDWLDDAIDLVWAAVDASATGAAVQAFQTLATVQEVGGQEYIVAQGDAIAYVTR